MICIIPARGGSKRIPRKNIKLFHGKPIIAYSIETAQKTGLFDEIWVSTEDTEISEISFKYGASIAKRTEGVDDTTGTQEVIRNAIRDIGYKGEVVCCLYATSPLLTPEWLIYGYKMLKYYDPIMEYALSVGTEPLRDAGNFYWGFRRAFEKDIPVHDRYSVMVPLPDEIVIDINTMDDWNVAEEKYNAINGRILERQFR